MNSNMSKIPVSRGFTLIELLVVVLIIAVLAAVALPQYQLAVAKSRVTGILPLIHSIRQAEQLYYLNNGSYTPHLSKLDLQIVGDAGAGGMIHDDFHLNMMSDRFILSYCPSSGFENGSAKCMSNRLLAYVEYFDNSTPKSCGTLQNTALSTKLCQILLNS